MKEVRYFCEECEMYFDSIEELEEMIIIGGYHNVMCCPNCRKTKKYRKRIRM